ncbi:MAG TPA: M1 family metallopeptidase, partial [Chitinophaga sp.]|uniref:M1 family metallopeptidase n=1 Tax=Chitinophaga sp. TaxID=1869181 RepID=UPI002F928185
ERAWWDVVYYDLSIHPDLVNKTIYGKNIISYKVVKTNKKELMQIDLQDPLHIDSVMLDQEKLSFQQDGSAWFIKVPLQKENTTHNIAIYYSGKPVESVKPPWDGGVVWAKDSLGRPWISVACQLTGASIWYPCKVHQSDEPDKGASITIITPDSLPAIGNGRLQRKTNNQDGTSSYTWAVVNPINNYGISFYIGKYVKVAEVYNGEKGPLDMEYWVLDYNQQKVKDYLKAEVNKTMKSFEHWFGPYPFYEDGFKMVEAPYIGMEHQGAIAYGNGFRLGRINFKNLNPWDRKMDRLVVHEMAHEWFGNNITTKDFTDRWVHEGFAGFAEELYIEYQYGKQAAEEFFIARTNKRIDNEKPVIQRYGIFEDAGGDMYLKGWVVVHMIRAMVNDDTKFRRILRGLNSHFYHKTVTSKQVEDYISKAIQKDLTVFFDQYLRRSALPVLEYKLQNGVLAYRFSDCIKGFSMPLKTNLSNHQWLTPTTEWKSIRMVNEKELIIDKGFYLDLKQVK